MGSGGCACGYFCFPLLMNELHDGAGIVVSVRVQLALLETTSSAQPSAVDLVKVLLENASLYFGSPKSERLWQLAISVRQSVAPHCFSHSLRFLLTNVRLHQHLRSFDVCCVSLMSLCIAPALFRVRTCRSSCAAALPQYASWKSVSLSKKLMCCSVGFATVQWTSQELRCKSDSLPIRTQTGKQRQTDGKLADYWVSRQSQAQDGLKFYFINTYEHKCMHARIHTYIHMYIHT